jgi:deazaflavin-dependent oxidoreductase (nitroreductase family)
MSVEIDPRLAGSLRQAFKLFNRYLMLPLWRLGLGSWVNLWPEVGGRIMVLTHTGRRSGRRRRTPVNYTIINGDIYCTAGFGDTADWYRNIQADPHVEVWLPDGWWAGKAEEVSDEKIWLPAMRQVLIASGMVAPLFGINPKTMTDEELRAATAGYRLIRIHRQEARTGPQGPGDLSWIWPVLVMILLPLALRRRRK